MNNARIMEGCGGILIILILGGPGSKFLSEYCGEINRAAQLLAI